MKRHNKFLSLLLGFCFICLFAFVGCEEGNVGTTGEDEYNCRLTFYVHPENPTEDNNQIESQFGVYGVYGRYVMDNMVKLLESEMFTEQLILNGETLPKFKYDAGEITPLGNVVPMGASWSWLRPPTQEEREVADEDTVFAYDEFQTALAEAEIARAVANQHLEEVKRLNVGWQLQMEDYVSLAGYLENEWRTLYANGLVSHSAFSESEYRGIIENSEKVNSGDYDELIHFYEEIESVSSQMTEIKDDIDELNKQYFFPADDAKKKALDVWRATEGYKAIFEMYQTSVIYSFDVTIVDEDVSKSRSFIIVDIAAPKSYGYDFAVVVRERVKKVVPLFVEKNMTISNGYEGTNCELVTMTEEFY